MDLSKAYNCIPHDLLIAKGYGYGLIGNTMKYTYTYLKYHKQYVRVSNVCSDFKDIISGVPQRLIVGSMLFNVFLNISFASENCMHIILLGIIHYHYLHYVASGNTNG